MAHFVGDDVGARKLARCPEFRRQLIEKIEINIEFLIAGTIERTGGGTGGAAGRLHFTVKQHQCGRRITLTAGGKKEMREVGKFLHQLKVRPELIVTSPLPRAAQTAEIAAEYLKAKLREDELLSPGFGMSELRTLLKRHRAESLMVVGHEPDFTDVISKLTGASLKLSKGGVALVDVDLSSEEGRLLWLFPPKFSRKSK